MMKIQRIKVSAVSYLNTLPFIYGINNSKVIESLDLSLDIPSDCATKLLNGKVDLGIVPIAILPQLKEYYIISDYCLGTEGKVASVSLFSDVPLNEIESIYLDYQSKTSINLVKILAKEYWKISPKWIDAAKGYENKISGNSAGVIIGDRTFNLCKSYNYVYDLAEEWKKLTDLPFVFACWVTNKKLPQEFLNDFNNALKYGVDHIESLVLSYKGTELPKDVLHNYLTQNMSYKLDGNKQKAIKLFLNYMGADKVSISET